MGKKKIAFLLSSFGIGGAERQYWYLIEHIDRSLYDVFVIQISHKKNRAINLVHEGVEVCTFERNHKLDIGIIFRILKYVRENNIDLIQSLLFLDNQIAKFVGLLSSKPVITSVRGGPHEGRLKTWLDLGCGAFSKFIVVNSHWLKRIMTDRGVKPEKIVVIHNGINPSKFRSPSVPDEIRNKYQVGLNEKRLTIVARLHPMKQHKMFFDVLRLVREKVPNTRAFVAGDGEIRKELEEYVRDKGIEDDVIFLGALKGQDLPDLLLISDVLLLTSAWGESLPNVLLEAMSAGVPVVSTNIHGIPEIVDDGVDGFTVDKNDTEGMAKQAVKLLTDDTVRQSIIKKGFHKVQTFKLDDMVKKYEELYSYVLKS